MINNNHKESGCGYAEQLISYLYDESNDAEKAVFERHLAACPVCADELEEFSGVHFSINDWKMKDFALLESPLIAIPYEKPENTGQISSPSGSWLAGWRNLFSFSPVWSISAAAFAFLIVGVGLALFFIKFNNPNEVAESNKMSMKPVVSPTVEKKVEELSEVGPKNKPTANTNEKSPKLNPETPSSQTDLTAASGGNQKKENTVKVTNNPRPTPKPEAPNKQNDTKNTKKSDPKKENPVISPYEDEDDSLRLSELFEEIDTK